MQYKKLIVGVRRGGRPERMLAGSSILLLLACGANTAWAHGFAGDRFFPATIQTDDPFAVDEVAFPTVATFVNPGTPAVRETDVSLDVSKEIFPRFALGLSATSVTLAPPGRPAVSGFDNLGVSAKYMLWLNGPHEAIFSAGVDWDVGGTGSRNIGADTAQTFTPTLYFGKGFGDLPDALNYAKPLAITGTLGEGLPTRADPNTLEWGLAVEYNLPYLQAQVKDLGLPAPIKHLIPVVEFAFATPENRGGGPTVGTINPGLFYESNYFQVGAEAIIPANHDSGSGIGAVVQIQIYIDDLWPHLFGHPLIGHYNM